MYIPNRYSNDNLEEIKAFIKANSFGILVTHHDNTSHATHIPLELVTKADGTEVLQAHISKLNPQTKHFKHNTKVLCIFNGPHTYISSSWYDHENVPTWNYIAVHIYGNVRVLNEEESWHAIKHLVDKYESDSENPVRIEDLSEKTMTQMKGITAFEIDITDIQGKYKLSQNRNDKNFNAVIDKLEEKNDASSQAVADAMKRLKH